MSWCAGLANTLVRLAKGAASRSEKLQTRIDRRGRGHDGDLITELALARREEAQACWLARDIRMLTQWLNHDVLALAGPVLATRQVLFDFIVDELTRREPEDRHRIRPVRIALQLFSPSPACSMRNWRPSRASIRFLTLSCVRPAFCTVCQPRHHHIGGIGTGYAGNPGTDFTICSPR